MVLCCVVLYAGFASAGFGIALKLFQRFFCCVSWRALQGDTFDFCGTHDTVVLYMLCGGLWRRGEGGAVVRAEKAASRVLFLPCRADCKGALLTMSKADCRPHKIVRLVAGRQPPCMMLCLFLSGDQSCPLSPKLSVSRSARGDHYIYILTIPRENKKKTPIETNFRAGYLPNEIKFMHKWYIWKELVEPFPFVGVSLGPCTRCRENYLGSWCKLEAKLFRYASACWCFWGAWHDEVRFGCGWEP